MKTDKRKSVRRAMQYTAWIAQPGQPLLGCLLSDISEHGARIDVESIDSVPDEFMLFLSRRGTPRRKCRVAWRSAEQNQIGLKFEAPPAPAKNNSKAKAMIAAHRASLQPDMNADMQADASAPDAAPLAPAATNGKDEKEPA
jgi:hypothetical protein